MKDVIATIRKQAKTFRHNPEAQKFCKLIANLCVHINRDPFDFHTFLDAYHKYCSIARLAVFKRVTPARPHVAVIAMIQEFCQSCDDLAVLDFLGIVENHLFSYDNLTPVQTSGDLSHVNFSGDLPQQQAYLKAMRAQVKSAQSNKVFIGKAHTINSYGKVDKVDREALPKKLTQEQYFEKFGEDANREDFNNINYNDPDFVDPKYIDNLHRTCLYTNKQALEEDPFAEKTTYIMDPGDQEVFGHGLDLSDLKIDQEIGYTHYQRMKEKRKNKHISKFLHL